VRIYHLLLKEPQTKPNQTKPKAHFVYNQPLLLQRVGPQEQKLNLLTPTFQVSRPVLEPKSCRVTSENPSDPKDNAPKTLPSFSLRTPTPLNANLEHTSVKFSRMLHSLHGIKISQKNTLENIFPPVDFKKL